MRQFAKISFNDKDLLGRFAGKKNNDVVERIITGKSSNKTDGTNIVLIFYNLNIYYF